MNFEEKSDIVYKILEIAKKDQLNSSQKEIIYNIVHNLKDATDLQIERMILFYNLKIDERKYRICDLARRYKCTSNAIKFSIARTKNRLIHIPDKEMLILKNILEECIKEHTINFEEY